VETPSVVISRYGVSWCSIGSTSLYANSGWLGSVWPGAGALDPAWLGVAGVLIAVDGRTARRGGASPGQAKLVSGEPEAVVVRWMHP
jgi:hypothetical protein